MSPIIAVPGSKVNLGNKHLRQPAAPILRSPYSDLILRTSGLVAYWRLNENSGTVAADQMNANPGTYVNFPTLGIPGALTGDPDRATTFTGASSQYIQPSLLFNQTKATIEAWVRISATPANKVLIAGGINGLGSLTTDKLLYIDTDGKLYFYAFDGNQKTTSTPASALTTNIWHHVVGTADGINLRAYVDGVQVGSVACGNTYAAYSLPNLFITGNSGFSGISYISGSIDEVAVYNRALIRDEIAPHYGYGIGSYYPFSISANAGSETDSAQLLTWKHGKSLTAAPETDAAQDFMGLGGITHIQHRHLPPRVRGIPSKFLQWRNQ